MEPGHRAASDTRKSQCIKVDIKWACTDNWFPTYLTAATYDLPIPQWGLSYVCI